MANSTDFRIRSVNADLWINRDEFVPKNTPMRNFYRGKTIFLTGGTGFLGQLWVEKLLRSDLVFEPLRAYSQMETAQLPMMPINLLLSDVK